MLNKTVHKYTSKTIRLSCYYYKCFDLSPFHSDFRFKRVVFGLVFTNKSKLLTAAAVMPCCWPMKA